MTLNELIRQMDPTPIYFTPFEVMLELMGDHVPLENPPFEEGGKP